MRAVLQVQNTHERGGRLLWCGVKMLRVALWQVSVNMPSSNCPEIRNWRLLADYNPLSVSIERLLYLCKQSIKTGLLIKCMLSTPK